MTGEVSILVAFAAGIISFLSPCVLPLVPPYLCFLAGVSLDDLTEAHLSEKETARQVLLTAVFFVIGFSTVFVALGATASAIGQLVASNLVWLAKIAGVIIIIMGLHFLGLFRLAALGREARFYGPSVISGPGGAYVMGLAFALGWTPCIGPVLAAILAVAASETSVASGAGLLAVYSAGIGVPFLLAAFAIKPFMRFMHHFKQHLTRVEKAMGGLLVLTGIMFITGDMSRLSYWLLETFPTLGTIG
jgi:cytochrome c-type biogenesis protein